MLVTGLAAKQDWAEANPDQVEAVIRGTDRGVQWMRTTPMNSARVASMKIWRTRRAGCWIPRPPTRVLERLAAGEWFVASDVYTQEWIDATYRFIESGQGTMVEEVAKEDIFHPPLD